MELPDIIFNDTDYDFDCPSFIQSLKLPPLDESASNELIPFEEIHAGQYKEGARMNSFKANKKRLPYWIKALTVRYWDVLGRRSDFHVHWEDKRKQNVDEIQIKVESKVDKSKSSTKSANTKSFVITVYLKTGTITTQGNYFQYLSDHEFPSLQSYVNNCAEKFEANTETNNESPKIQSENDASCDKTKQF
jgi:hypothetical protein